MNRWIALCLCLTALSCRQSKQLNQSLTAAPQAARPLDPISLVLAPHTGTGRVDREIIRLQSEVRAGKNLELSLERLGWSFVTKARESFDPGYYKLAEQCALALESRQPKSLDALLLRGHVLHNLHRFKEAEPLAQELVTQRGLPVDFGLLSDVLMEQGKLPEAIEACQKMVDLRPDLHSYARGAHLRWLKGNVQGAAELMRLAAGAASPLDSESAAWVNIRLAGYEFQLGNLVAAEQCCAASLEFQKDYPPALLLRGRILLAQGRAAAAAEVLQRAAELNPLPEYQWTFAEALRADGRVQQAARVETLLRQKGAAADPRNYSLYLATRGESVATGLRLAQAELSARSDVLTHDALAWSLAACGKTEEARERMAKALAEGTQDARLLFHAAMIARQAGNGSAAQRYASKVSDLKRLLLPSEREQFQTAFPLAETVVAEGGTDNNKPETK